MLLVFAHFTDWLYGVFDVCDADPLACAVWSSFQEGLTMLDQLDVAH